MTPTGRYITQQMMAERWLNRMQDMLMRTAGIRHIANDEFEVDLSKVDFAEIEKRVMLAMREERDEQQSP